jgi:alpha-D-ribose 1-methylphosphonate 5-triphosphate synthase subunit PhnH
VSTAILAGHYDEVLDAQKHYRTLLDCTARPGTIGQLDDVAMELPSQYNHATALIVMALFGGDTTFHLAEPEGQGLERESEFIRSVSGAKPVAAEEADFLVFFHAEDLQKSEVRTGIRSNGDRAGGEPLAGTNAWVASAAPHRAWHRDRGGGVCHRSGGAVLCASR